MFAGCAKNSAQKAPVQVKDIPLSLTKVDNQYEQMETLYAQDFQDKVHEEIQQLKEAGDYTQDNPLMIANPYGTITNSLYIYFTTKDKVQLQYTIKAEGYGDFTQTVFANSGDNLSTEHETALIGIVPEVENQIILRLINEEGKDLGGVQFTYSAPPANGEYVCYQTELKKGPSTQELSDGLYVVLGNDSNAETGEATNRFISMYDNNGVIRCVIPIIEYRVSRILFHNNLMYFNTSHNQIVCMDKTGYIAKSYMTGQYEQHHDYILGSNNDLLLLGSDPASETTEDIILDISLDSGEVTKLIDLRDYFENYYKMTSLSKGKSQIDWMHINSLTLTQDNKLLLSSRETSTIIAFENFYSDDRKVSYMLGSDNFWKGTGYEDLLFAPDDNFSLNAGQHQITYIEDDTLEDGQYYLVMFNNNNLFSGTRPDYDWLSDDNYSGTGVDSKGQNSYYYKYKVDEKSKTFTLVNSIPVAYSAYVSGIQNLDNGNILVDSGSALTGYEFDSNNELIQSFTVTGDKWTYRIMNLILMVFGSNRPVDESASRY